jgi:hypothetical protein
MSTSGGYSVLVCEYAKKHFMKSFLKKYKTAWERTEKTIFLMLERIERYSATSKVNKIHISNTRYIAKCEFTVEWQNISTKAAGNRIIVFVDEELKTVQILLVYSKNDVVGNNETQWWEQVVKENYDEIYKVFKY